MYVLPLPEFKVDRDALLDFADRIQEDEWEEHLPGVGIFWVVVSQDLPIYQSALEQFAYPFNREFVTMRFLRLVAGGGMVNHTDANRQAVLVCNLEGWEGAVFQYNKEQERCSETATSIMQINHSATPLLVNAQRFHSTHGITPRLAVHISFYKPYDFDFLEHLYRRDALFPSSGS